MLNKNFLDMNSVNIWLSRHPEVTKYQLVNLPTHMVLRYAKPTNVWGNTFYR